MLQPIEEYRICISLGPFRMSQSFEHRTVLFAFYRYRTIHVTLRIDMKIFAVLTILKLLTAIQIKFCKESVQFCLGVEVEQYIQLPTQIIIHPEFTAWILFNTIIAFKIIILKSYI
jgi:hypothetical protein